MRAQRLEILMSCDFFERFGVRKESPDVSASMSTERKNKMSRLESNYTHEESNNADVQYNVIEYLSTLSAIETIF